MLLCQDVFINLMGIGRDMVSLSRETAQNKKYFSPAGQKEFTVIYLKIAIIPLLRKSEKDDVQMR